MKREVIKLKNHFFASCPTGLEEILEQEILKAGATKTQAVKGGVNFESLPEVALLAIIHSRVASRVFKKIYQFDIKEEKDIYHHGMEIKWKAIFNIDQTFKVTTIQGKSPDGKKRSQFRSSIFLAQQLKDAIVDRYRKDEKGLRPDVDKKYAHASIFMRVEPHNNEHSTKEAVTILLDLCGDPLSNRGYRQNTFIAPLRENLAAGIIKLTGYTGKETIIDGMSGSGTLVTEAALIKADLPPTYLKIMDHFEEEIELPWIFLDLNLFTKDKYLSENFTRILKETYDHIKAQMTKMKSTKPTIYAFDNNKDSLAITKQNLQTAMLDSMVVIENHDVTSVQSKGNKGIFVVNPPYGERMAEEIEDIKELEDLYYGIGENLKKNFTDFDAFIFTGAPQLLKKISLRTSKKHILYNGNLEARLAHYKMY